MYLGNTRRDGQSQSWSCGPRRKSFHEPDARPGDEKNWKTAWPPWIPILPLLGWYWSSLVFLASVLWVPRLLARGAEGQVAGGALHWHQCSWLARCNVAHGLAVGCGAPCSLGIQVDLWNATEREMKLFIQSSPCSSDMCLGIQHPILHESVGAKALCTHAKGHLGLLFFRQVCICAQQLRWKHCNNGNTLHRTCPLPFHREVQNMNLTAACWEARVFCNTRSLHVFHVYKPCSNFHINSRKTAIKLMSSHFPCLIYSPLSINSS